MFSQPSRRRYSAADRWRELRTLFGTRHRRRFVAAVLVWLSIDFWNSCAMFSFSFYAQTERGWTPADLAEQSGWRELAAWLKAGAKAEAADGGE